MEKLKDEFGTKMNKVHQGMHNVNDKIHQVVAKAATPHARRSSVLSLWTVRDIEKLSQKRGKNTAQETFKVVPDYAYPNTRMNREELRKEMNKKSAYYHDLRLASDDKGVGEIAVEILQCFGVPKTELLKETSEFCVLVCGQHAFKTDVMPPVANPMWLSKMRRACIFPVHHAYARLYVGAFGQGEKKDSFAGRVVVDLSRLRPNCTYDITLPLRLSAQVYSREQRGAIRFRFHLTWYSERQAILSYLPQKVPKIEPNESVTVPCCDAKSFQNVARVVHGVHMPGRFTKKQLQATIREINFTRIHVLRYMRKREFRSLCQWEHPIISGYVFFAWMHSVYTASVAYIPGHVLTYLLLHLWKNYAIYAMESPFQNGFLHPSWEEMFLALLLGKDGRSYIEPLEMEMKDETLMKSAGEDMAVSSMSSLPANDDAEASLKEIAQAFRAGVQVHTLRRRLRAYHNAFKGSDGVDFLVDSGYALSRSEAEELGQRLASEFKLFEHVEKKHRFRDSGLFYVFLEYDLNEYIMKTHRPWGRSLFRFLGFLPDKELTEAQAHLEMPYSEGTDHPRFTVKESLVIRSRESRRLLSEENKDGDMDDLEDSSEHFKKGLDEFLDEHDNEDEAERLDSELENGMEDKVGYEVKILKKPPQQDINVRKKPDKKLTAVLAEARHKVHGVLLHSFNDRVYTIQDGEKRVATKSPLSKRVVKKSASSVGFSVKNVSPRRLRKRSSSTSTTSEDQRASFTSTERSLVPVANVESVVEEYDRLLGTGKYSHGNPWVSKIGVLVQPIVEIVLEWVCLFRALFNIFTWRDPILSFWVSVIGPFVVIILHLFPWRWVLGVLGFVLIGPHKWALRIWKERKHGREPYDPDRIVKKKPKPKELESKELPLFSMYAPDNRPLDKNEIDDSNIREVVVPYSQLMYQRFYDWPPENEYARVKAEAAPECDPESSYSYLTNGIGVAETSVKGDTSDEFKASPRRMAHNLRSRFRNRRKSSESERGRNESQKFSVRRIGEVGSSTADK